MGFSTLDFKCVLVTGGGGGIGKAFAEYFLSLNKKVIIAGRTESKLQEASKDLKNCPYYVLDTGDIPELHEFTLKVTREHPDLDCLVNNAGVQRPLDVNKMSPEEFLDKADNELYINAHGPMHLAINLLPHFKSKSASGSGAVIMNVSSILAYNPTSIINPVYNATKAFIHFWSMNLRTQLELANQRVKIVEIAPPSVGTDLHRERQNPDDNKKAKGASSMDVDEFMREVIMGWKQDRDIIGAGPSQAVIDSWYETFGGAYRKAEGK